MIWLFIIPTVIILIALINVAHENYKAHYELQEKIVYLDDNFRMLAQLTQVRQNKTDEALLAIAAKIDELEKKLPK